MKLNPEELLSSIIKLKKDICAPDVIWTPSETNFPDNITIRGIPESITSGPGKLIVRHSGDTKDNMEQYLLYIPSPDKRFHFMECRTIRDMRKNGRGNRYILTRDITGEFEIYIEGRKVKEHLQVCKNCLEEWNYKGYRCLSSREQQNQAVKNFNIKEFFENCKPLFQSLPIRTNQTMLNGDEYDRNWKYISRAYRASRGWCCERCGVNLSDRPEFLHTHHVDGNKYNIKSDNLKVLCILCHSEQPQHEHIKKQPEFRKAKEFILHKERKFQYSKTEYLMKSN